MEFVLRPLTEAEEKYTYSQSIYANRLVCVFESVYGQKRHRIFFRVV